MTSAQTVPLALVSAACLIIGILGGVLIERMRFDHRRSAIVRQYEERLRERNEALMKIELTQQRRAAETP